MSRSENLSSKERSLPAWRGPNNCGNASQGGGDLCFDVTRKNLVTEEFPFLNKHKSFLSNTFQMVLDFVNCHRHRLLVLAPTFSGC